MNTLMLLCVMLLPCASESAGPGSLAAGLQEIAMMPQRVIEEARARDLERLQRALSTLEGAKHAQWLHNEIAKFKQLPLSKELQDMFLGVPGVAFPVLSKAFYGRLGQLKRIVAAQDYCWKYALIEGKMFDVSEKRKKELCADFEQRAQGSDGCKEVITDFLRAVNEIVASTIYFGGDTSSIMKAVHVVYEVDSDDVSTHNARDVCAGLMGNSEYFEGWKHKDFVENVRTLMVQGNCIADQYEAWKSAWDRSYRWAELLEKQLITHYITLPLRFENAFEARLDAFLEQHMTKELGEYYRSLFDEIKMLRREYAPFAEIILIAKDGNKQVDWGVNKDAKKQLCIALRKIDDSKRLPQFVRDEVRKSLQMFCSLTE